MILLETTVLLVAIVLLLASLPPPLNRPTALSRRRPCSWAGGETVGSFLHSELHAFFSYQQARLKPRRVPRR